MQIRSKLALVAAAAVLTASLSVIADVKSQTVTKDYSVTLKCVDVNTMVAMLKNANYTLVFTGASSENGVVDSITQTWAGEDGSWVTIEFVKEIKQVCVLSSGNQSRLHVMASGKSTWI